MSSTAIQSDRVVNYAVKSLIKNFDFQLFTKETLKKMPQHTFSSFSRVNSNLIHLGNMPKPIYKHQPQIEQELMPNAPPQQAMLSSKVSVHKKSEMDLQTPYSSNIKRRIFSRYASTSQKKQLKNNIHLDLSQLKENKVIQIVNRSQQNTAKTFRSVIELDSQIAEMRKKYLRDLRNQQQLKLSMTQQNFNFKKKRIPKQFTFDFSGQLLEKRNSITKKTVFSPLRSKSVSVQKVQKKMKQRRESYQEDSSLQQRLQRSKTGSSERKIREFNNLNQRQVSHIPYISLAQNAKLYQNSTKIEGETKTAHLDSTVYSTKSSFMHYSDKNKANNQNPQKDRQNFPKSLQKSVLGQGRIIKNQEYKDTTNFDFVQVQISSNVEEKCITNKKALNS